MGFKKWPGQRGEEVVLIGVVHKRHSKVPLTFMQRCRKRSALRPRGLCLKVLVADAAFPAKDRSRLAAVLLFFDEREPLVPRGFHARVHAPTMANRRKREIPNRG